MTNVNIAKPKGRGAKAAQARRATKKGQPIKMLNGKNGSDIKTISAKLGWQEHTTRSALSGLRKAGYEIALVKYQNGKPSRYSIKSMTKLSAALSVRGQPDAA